MKKSILTTAKLLFSAALIAYLFVYRVDFREVVRVFGGVIPSWLIWGASLHLTGLFISAVRWKILLKAQGIQQPLSRLISYYLVGHFFNMFLPTKVGGDIIRIYDTSRDHGSSAQPFTVIMVERISGMLTMLLIAAVVLAVNLDIGFDVRAMAPGLGMFVGVFIAGICLSPFCFHPAVERLLLMLITRLPIVSKLEGTFRKIFAAFRVYGNKTGYLAAAVAVGFLLQINYFLHYYFIARSLGMAVPLSFFFVIIPIRTVTLMIPFFVNGIGLREFFDVHAFSLVGAGEHTAIAFAELAWFVQIGFALLGGIVYVVRKRNISSETGGGV